MRHAPPQCWLEEEDDGVGELVEGQCNAWGAAWSDSPPRTTEPGEPFACRGASQMEEEEKVWVAVKQDPL